MKKLMFIFIMVAFIYAILSSAVLATEENESAEQKGEWQHKRDELNEQWEEKQAERKEQREKAIEDLKQKQAEKKEQREKAIEDLKQKQAEKSNK